MTMKVYEAMAKAFLEEFESAGIDALFSYMGDANMYWMSTLLGQSDVRNVHVRHENAAVAMADGYARATGRVGVATVTSGPGLAHVATALTGAARYRVPLVLFAGDTAPHDTTALQYVDQAKFADLCGVHFEPVTSAAQALSAVQAAFYRAAARSEPVLLSVPMNIQDEELPGEYAYTPSTALVQEGAGLPDADSLDEAAGLLASARRPVILIGNGAVTGGALSAIEALGDRIGALYATTLLAKGALDDSPWAIGISGTFSHPQAEQVLGDADLVIGVGASMNRFTLQDGYMFPNARTIQILDRPAAEAAPRRPVTRYLQGDAARTVEALEAMLAEAEYMAVGWRSRFERADRDPRTFAEGGTVGPDENALDPRDAVAALEKHIPDNALVVLGAGHFWSFVNKGLTGRGGRRYLYALGFGSIGQALPVAVGAAVGCPDRPVVVVDGDSSILFHPQELDAASRLGVNLLAVVLDDDAMGAELHKLVVKDVYPDAAIVATPDLALMAQAFGASGSLVRSPDELDKVLDSYDWQSVHLIDVKVSRSVVDVSSVMGNEVKTT
jgi:thiamine pyrophosphate-dependent acetolactate synthase large subunit-like protein